jgi:hypothetical protein
MALGTLNKKSKIYTGVKEIIFEYMFLGSGMSGGACEYLDVFHQNSGFKKF